MIAQVGGGGGRCQAAGTGRREETAARRQAHIGEGGVFGGIAEPVKVLEHDPVGDGHAGGERRDGIVRSGGLEHEGLGRVGDEEGRVVRLLVGGVGDAALPARLEEPAEDVDGLHRAAGAFEPETDQVHADQPGRGRGGVVGGADTLVPDGDTVLVDPVLGAPEPCGTGEQGGVGARVTDGEVLRAQRAARRGPPAKGPGDLDLPGRPVRVLGEHHAALTGSTERVAHSRSVGRVDRVATRGTTRRPHG